MNRDPSIVPGQHAGTGLPGPRGLYDPRHEKDSCGVGFIAHIKGERSHGIVLDAAEMLNRMTHRGACGCEPNTGDGAGFLTALPHEFLAGVAKSDLGVELPEPGRFAAGNNFLPRDTAERRRCKETVERLVVEQGQELLGWRRVPTSPEEADIGPSARASEPVIEQLLVGAGEGLEGDLFERRLFVIRKRASHELRTSNLREARIFYICSLSI